MHRALQINEILRLVFNLLEEAGYQRELAASAVVCQDFKDPALDALWRHLHGLLPLISVLPTETVESSLILAPGDISDDEWARFDSYAIRVHIFTNCERLPDHRDLKPIHPSVYIRLARTKSTILPRLHKMYIANINDNTTMELMICLSNSIRYVELPPDGGVMDYHDRRYNIGTVLDAFSSYSYPNVESLVISVILSDSYVTKLLPLQNLRTLRFITPSSPENTPDVLHKLSTLPKLEQLSFSSFYDGAIEPIRDEAFPALRQLQLPGSPKSITQILNALPSNRLEYFSAVDHRNWGDATTAQLRENFAEWRRCLVAVARHTSLTDLTFTIPTEEVDDDKMEEFRDIRYLDLWEPLLSIGGVEYFCVNSFTDMSLSDDDVFRIASAWPQLQNIDLSFSHETDRPSFLSLRYLAALCPKLTTLAISLNLEKEVQIIVSPPTSSHPLEELSLGFTNATDASIIVRNLKSLFPNLKEVMSYDTQQTSLLMGLLHSNTT